MSINLFPSHRAQWCQRLIICQTALLLLLLLSFISACYWRHQWQHQYQQLNHHNQTTQQLLNQQRQHNHWLMHQQQLSQLNRTLAFIKKHQRRQQQLIQLISLLANQMPTTMYLTTMNKTQHKIYLHGIANSDTTVNAFCHTLNKQGLVKRASVTNFSQTTTPDHHSFSIIITLREHHAITHKKTSA